MCTAVPVRWQAPVLPWRGRQGWPTYTLYCAALAEDFGPGHVGRSVGPFPQVRRRSWVSSEDAWPGEELETWHDGTPDLLVFKKFAGIISWLPIGRPRVQASAAHAFKHATAHELRLCGHAKHRQSMLQPPGAELSLGGIVVSR